MWCSATTGACATCPARRVLLLRGLLPDVLRRAGVRRAAATGRAPSCCRVCIFLLSQNPNAQVASLGEVNTGEPSLADTPYAELWLGTHPSGAARLEDSGALLSAWLADAPAARLGEPVATRWNGALPFLLKVLSVSKALSIQAHPDIALATRLARQFPEIYKDGNHKPEMALALTPFTALVGFAPRAALAASLEEAPEVLPLLGESGPSLCAAAACDDAAAKGELRSAFGCLMRTPPADAAAAVRALVHRLSTKRGAGGALSPREALALLLDAQYPGDVGVLASFFLNLLVLAPGQAVALAANEPHAYVAGACGRGQNKFFFFSPNFFPTFSPSSLPPDVVGLWRPGECVECMATSDNVVRAGLTPKLRDVDTLVDSATPRFLLLRGRSDTSFHPPSPHPLSPPVLSYTQADPIVYAGEGAGPLRTYAPPFDEFAVDSITLSPGQRFDLPVRNCFVGFFSLQSFPQVLTLARVGRPPPALRCCWSRPGPGRRGTGLPCPRGLHLWCFRT